MNSSSSRLVLTRLGGITIVSLITCLAISFPVAPFISSNNIFTLCPKFNLKAFQTQQLYQIRLYIGSLIIIPGVCNFIYSSSNSSCCTVHLNIDMRKYGSPRPPCLLMKSTNCSRRLTSVYEASSFSGAWTKSFPFDNQWITTMNIIFGNSGRLHISFLPSHSPKSVPSGLLPRLPLFLACHILLAHFFKNTSTHCQGIHSALSKSTNGSKFLNVSKTSATTVSQCSGPSWTCFNRFCPRIMDQCFLSRNPTTHTLFHLLNTL